MLLYASFGRELWRMRTGQGDRSGETRVVEHGGGELVEVCAGGEEKGAGGVVE